MEIPQPIEVEGLGKGLPVTNIHSSGRHSMIGWVPVGHFNRYFTLSEEMKDLSSYLIKQGERNHFTDFYTGAEWLFGETIIPGYPTFSGEKALDYLSSLPNSALQSENFFKLTQYIESLAVYHVGVGGNWEPDENGRQPVVLQSDNGFQELLRHGKASIFYPGVSESLSMMISKALEVGNQEIQDFSLLIKLEDIDACKRVLEIFGLKFTGYKEAQDGYWFNIIYLE